MQIFADGFTKVSLSGGVLRLTLVQTVNNNQTTEVGQLLIPAVQAEAFLNGMAGALRQLAEQAKQAQAGEGKPSEQGAEPSQG
ncbi:hypothetical protein [Synechocystis sp. LKSZ1]|uniref:hypothetical protein n=1 Tax=Synechocystis sp. LKSZ1 TaxID=3144951 RepID=UPI00336C27AF